MDYQHNVQDIHSHSQVFVKVFQYSQFAQLEHLLKEREKQLKNKLFMLYLCFE